MPDKPIPFCWDCRRMLFDRGGVPWDACPPDIRCARGHWDLFGDDEKKDIEQCMRMAVDCPNFYWIKSALDVVDLQEWHIWIRNDDGVNERAPDFVFLQDPKTGKGVGMDGERYRVVEVATKTRKVVLQKIEETDK